MARKALKTVGAVAHDEDAQQRLDMVKEFNELCHSNGLLSIIEPSQAVRRAARQSSIASRRLPMRPVESYDSGADLQS